MKLLDRKFKWWKLILILLIVLVCIGWYFVAGNSMRFTDIQVSDYFKERNVEYKINNIKAATGGLRFISSGLQSTDAETTIIFIHGAPGASDSFYSYLADLSLIDKAQLISLDRPGYGYSSYGKPTVSITDQAEAVMSIIKSIQSKKIILVSHSYGCAVAGVLAAQRPDLIQANVMLCPVIDPAAEKIFFFSSWPSLPMIKNLFSGAIQVSSFEKMSHAAELEDIEYLWSKTEVPTMLYHGEKDWIAPIENAYYLDDKIDSTFLTVDVDKEASHFIVWEQHDKVVQKILEFL